MSELFIFNIRTLMFLQSALLEDSLNILGYIIVFMEQAFLIRCHKNTKYIAHYIWYEILVCWCAAKNMVCFTYFSACMAG